MPLLHPLPLLHPPPPHPPLLHPTPLFTPFCTPSPPFCKLASSGNCGNRIRSDPHIILPDSCPHVFFGELEDAKSAWKCIRSVKGRVARDKLEKQFSAQMCEIVCDYGTIFNLKVCEKCKQAQSIGLCSFMRAKTAKKCSVLQSLHAQSRARVLSPEPKCSVQSPRAQSRARVLSPEPACSVLWNYQVMQTRNFGIKFLSLRDLNPVALK